MELLDAIETASLTKIKEVIKTKSILLDNNSLSCRALMRAFAYERKDVVRFLLKNYCQVDLPLKTYSFTTTPLHCAVKLRDVSLIKEILQKKPSIVADSDTNTALHLAFLHKHEEAIDLILKHIEQTSNYNNSKNKYGLTHIHIACTRANTQVIEGFIKTEISLNESVDENSPYWAKYTALHFASAFGSLPAFNLLYSSYELFFNNTINTNSSMQIVYKQLEDLLVMSYFLDGLDGYDSDTYFHLACVKKDLSLLKKFIDNGAGVDYCFPGSPFNSNENTALHVAVEYDRKATVELLLQQHIYIDFDTKNKQSMTALHCALYKESQTDKNSILDLLYNKTINKDTADNDEDVNGLGYFEIAVTRNDIEMVNKYLDKDLDINKLIKPNQKGFSHFTPLHFAILYKHKEMAKLLIKHCVNVDLTGEKNEYGTPLHMAFEIGHIDLIELLLKSGANPNVVRSIDGKTMLHLLVPHFKIQNSTNNPPHKVLSFDKEAILMYVEQLVKLGNNVNVQDKNGYTALHCIHPTYGQCVGCLQLLLELGADINLEDSDGNLPFSLRSYVEDNCTAREYLTFYHHVQKLKALGLNVHPQNNEFCKKMKEDWKKLDTSNKALVNKELACREQKRIDEIARLRNIMITPFMSLYNFLKLETRRAAAYMPNKVLQKILKDKDLNKKYPSYGYLIRLQCNRNTSKDFQAKYSDKRILSSDAESHPPKRQRFD